ncbi:SDR family NAD(P)-dependent oxidoreductase [Alteromonas sp. a30]|uniref:SDR family NAD(P)-dependent oxidoreductase n=1 Tax=Alteromonas sp. a30 TaxID=2730917 RepID=UPI002282E8FD|nr:SDR family NAD(P)-dependent oxidoreductase [Alteromonas sp. a30]MCY7295335.1 SDR family NAD(P)-dependent oxidoreductase [Alteromonas sp. a30]
MHQSQQKNALVIGLGGIGQAVAQALIDSKVVGAVYGVSRRSLPEAHALQQASSYHPVLVEDYEESSIENACAALPQGQFSLVVCTLGILHDSVTQLYPEKKLEDLTPSHLSQYFLENVTIPAIWLKHVVRLLAPKHPSQIVFLSARVGSISDNRLGGWYGYRSAKSALNMLVKTAQIEVSRRYKQCALVLYHPGTVDTRLSVPFQQNIPQEKLFTPEFTAHQLLSCLPNLAAHDAPHYIDWSGQTIPW